MPPVIPLVAGLVFKVGTAIGLEASMAAGLANAIAPAMVITGIWVGANMVIGPVEGPFRSKP